MNKLIPHIETLLINNDYVIIPNLGGFIVQWESAKISDNEIIPPSSTVGFNPLMCEEDGLLALEILRSENISYREAVKLIKKETETFKLDLQKEKEIIFGKLGSFSLNDNGQINFNPSIDFSFLPVNLGLKSVNTAKFRTKKAETITITLPKKHVFQYAAVALILLGIFLVSPQLNNSSVADYAALAPTKIIKAEPTLIATESTESQEFEEIVSDKETVILQSDEIVKEYHIVVACLPDVASAERYCDMLKNKNYDSAYVRPSIKTNRVIIKSFHDREEAITYMCDLRLNNKEFKDAWLHQQN